MNVWKEQTNSPHFCIHSVNAVGGKLESAFVKFSQAWCKKCLCRLIWFPRLVFVCMCMCMCVCACACVGVQSHSTIALS